MSRLSAYRRIVHAAHYGYDHPMRGHDLEEWDIASDLVQAEARRGTDVPLDAQYHVGYYDADGRHHWTYTRIAPMTGGTCERCK